VAEPDPGIPSGGLARLGELLAAAGEPIAGPLRATLLTGGRSNLTYRIDDGTSAWALRRPPVAAVVGYAHDVVREYRVVAALREGPVPVARAVVCDAEGFALGVPAAVVAFVEGRTVRSRRDLAGWTAEEVEQCIDGLVAALAALHEVDLESAGLTDFGRPGGYAGRQLATWSRQWERMGATDPRADRLHARLAAQVPDQERTAVVHGDYRIDNVLLHPCEPTVLAIVDWELSTTGDPVADVATMCAYRHPAFDLVLGTDAAWVSTALPTVPELRERYEAHVGRSLPSFGFHLALAYYKIAVIAAGIAYRHRHGASAGGDGYAEVADAVPLLLDAGLEASSARG
jgi:aminoglycoside phosphotransferase (APT) family kinase protein